MRASRIPDSFANWPTTVTSLLMSVPPSAHTANKMLLANGLSYHSVALICRDAWMFGEAAQGTCPASRHRNVPVAKVSIMSDD